MADHRDNNSAKTFGTQVAWNSEATTFSFNTLAGPEQPGNDDDWRTLGDLVLVSAQPLVEPRSQRRPGARNPPGRVFGFVVGAAGFARFAPSEALGAVPARRDVRRRDGAISEQAVSEGSDAHLEYVPSRASP